MASTKRYETQGFKVVETWLDAFYAAQERATTFGESYFSLLQEGQKTGFDLVFTSLKQMQDMQTLWFDFLRESVRSGNQTFASYLRVQGEVEQSVKDRFEQQVSEIEKVARASSK